jgi:hypothetical protein
VRHAYTIQAVFGHETKKLRCASAWVAYEQHNRLVRQGRKVRILNSAGKPVTIGQLEAAAQAETGYVMKGTEEPGGVPISARGVLMGS